ncbi:hypothetical protein B7463_g11773, partial [Scytalidium lignicola]
MNTEDHDPSLASFPSSWTLSKSNPPIADVAQSPVLLDAYPREWSLSTISESISDATETQDQATSQNTFRGEFPIALSNINETASNIISSPPTFERSWTLPRSASTYQPTPPHGDYRGLMSSTWSPGMPQHDMAEPAGLEGASLAGIMGSSPRHTIPNISSSSNQEQSTQSPGVSASAVPGNFRPRGRSNIHMSPQSNQGPVSAESSSLPMNRLVRRLAEYHHDISPSSAVSSGTAASSSLYGRGTVAGQVRLVPESAMTSPESGLWNGASYKPPRPAGFTSNHTSPQSVLENNSTSLQSYRLPQPAGFGPDNVSPPTSTDNQNHQIQHPAQFEHNETTINSLPISLLQRNPRTQFAPIEIPVQAAMLPTDANSWIYANVEHLYQPPTAPLTATPPWRSKFHNDGTQ